MTTPKIVRFFNNELRIGEADALFDEIMHWDDDRWELTHDFIQWVLPLDEPSNFNADAPILTLREIEDYKLVLAPGVYRAAIRFTQFLGLDYDDVVIKRSFLSSDSLWVNFNHNWLRITRCLRSLRLFSFDPRVKTLMTTFYAFLVEMFNDGFDDATTLKYWTDAVQKSAPWEKV